MTADTEQRDADDLRLLLAKIWGEYSSAKVADAILDAGFRRPREVTDDGWEYGLLSPDVRVGSRDPLNGAHLVSDNREHVERQHRRGHPWHPSIKFMRRRKAGPWLPVEPGEEA